MKNVWVIGAGQLGSRHLQALKKINHPLCIEVIDPNPDHLHVARARYDEIESGGCPHSILFREEMEFSSDTQLDLVIVATNSNVRRSVVEKVLNAADVKSMVLEKLLFQYSRDYYDMKELIQKAGSDVRVNCSMRVMPFYQALKTTYHGQPIFYRVSISNYGLITNLIHYLDHIAFLTGCSDFKLDTGLLCTDPIDSKRPGFLELNGQVSATFSDGSFGVFSCCSSGNRPVLLQIENSEARHMVQEIQEVAWTSRAEHDWKWEKHKIITPYQSEMTQWIAEQLLFGKPCSLVKYEESMNIHLQLLEPLREHLNVTASIPFNHYPFT